MLSGSLGGPLLIGSFLGVVAVLAVFPEYRANVSSAVLGRRGARQWDPVSAHFVGVCAKSVQHDFELMPVPIWMRAAGGNCRCLFAWWM